MKHYLFSLFMFFLILMTGCGAMQHIDPDPSLTINYEKHHNLSSELVDEKVHQYLAENGFRINLNTGTIITTEYKFERLRPKHAQCHEDPNFKYDMLRDNRSKAEYLYTVINKPGYIKIIAGIRAEYKVGSVTWDMTLTCISTGVLEQRMADYIFKES